MKCPHGYVAIRRQAEGYPLGWVAPVADECPLCEGRPCASPFLPGKPQGARP